jgi:hypothetical protein
MITTLNALIQTWRNFYWNGVAFLCVLVIGVTNDLSANQTSQSPNKNIQLEVSQSGGRYQTRSLRTTEEGIEISLPGGGGALIAWDFMDEFKVNKTVNADLNKALSSTNPTRRVQLLKPHIDPILPFAAVKDGTSNIHGLIDEYLQSVIKINDWLLAYEISQSLPLERAPDYLIIPLYRIVEKMFVIEKNDKALHLLSQLLETRPTVEFNRETTALAKRLAEQRLFGPAYELTRSSLKGADGLNARKFALRCAYLSLELEALDRAGDYIAQADSYGAIDDVESKELLNLSLGVQAFKSGDSRLALNHLGQALATAAVGSDVKQTALYYNYYIYSQIDQKLIVKNIFEEMSLLFPDGAYTNALAE